MIDTEMTSEGVDGLIAVEILDDHLVLVVATETKVGDVNLCSEGGSYPNIIAIEHLTELPTGVGNL